MHNSRFNVDKLNNIWIFAKYNLLKCQMYRKRREEMFNRLKLIIRNNELQKENEELYEENKLNREDISDLELRKVHAESLAEYTISKLVELEQIDRSGNSEEIKRKNRNLIFNDLRKRNINMIKELPIKFGIDR